MTRPAGRTRDGDGRGGGLAVGAGRQPSAHAGGGGHELGAAAQLCPWGVRRDESLQDPSASFRFSSVTTRGTPPRWSSAFCGVPAGQFATGVRGGHPPTVVASARRRGCIRSGGRQHFRRRPVHPRCGHHPSSAPRNIGRLGRRHPSRFAATRASRDRRTFPRFFDLLPGYLPMPKAGVHAISNAYLASIKSDGQKGFWTAADTYIVSLLKHGGGELQTRTTTSLRWLPRNQWLPQQLPDDRRHARRERSRATSIGQNPAVGSANGMPAAARECPTMKWLVVRDFDLIESATFWKDVSEIATRRDAQPRTSAPRCSSSRPLAQHREGPAHLHADQRLLQWHHKAVEPSGDCRSGAHFFYPSAGLLRERHRERRSLERDLRCDAGRGLPVLARGARC